MTTTIVAWNNLSLEERAILIHTRERDPDGRHCGDSEAIRRLVALRLMKSLGRGSWIPEEYFRLTTAGNLLLKHVRSKSSAEAPA